MAAQAYSGPVVVQEAVPAPAPVHRPSEPTAHESAPMPPPSDLPAAAAPAAPAAATDASEDGPDEDDNFSLYEEILENGDHAVFTDEGNDVFFPEDARRMRQRLHQVGPNQFILETVSTERVTARKLCSAFGVKIPQFMNDFPDTAFYQLLGLAINRELNKRPRLEQYRTIDDAAKLLRERKNIMVITGAGISTSLGIPDFRSKNTGFYSRLLEMGYNEPEQVFDIHNFDEDPTTFYNLAGYIVPDLEKWSPTHAFIRLLQDQNKLLTNYTQNIDNIESHAGIRREKLIQCHGSWATATCRKCKYKVPGEEIFDSVRAQTPAQCQRCVEDIAASKPGMKRKRSSNSNPSRKKPKSFDSDSDSDGAYDIPQPGIMKPDITFFGEALPNDFFDRLKDVDKNKVDLVIVIGTSMKVAPVSEIPNFVSRDVPQIYISRDPIHHINFDVNLLGDCDVVVTELARRAGWDLKHNMIPEEQAMNVKTLDEYEHTYTVELRNPAPKCSVSKDASIQVSNISECIRDM